MLCDVVADEEKKAEKLKEEYLNLRKPRRVTRSSFIDKAGARAS